MTPVFLAIHSLTRVADAVVGMGTALEEMEPWL